MPHSASRRLVSANPAPLPDQASAEPGTGPDANLEISPPQAAPPLRFGDYEVGDGACAELFGHPDIIY